MYGDSEKGIILKDFRRSAKTNMVAAGLKKEYRDKILGHSLKGMDRHYIVPSEKQLTDAMSQYTEWLNSQVNTVLENVDHLVDQATQKGLAGLAKSLILLVPPVGIEPTAPGLGILCSIH